MFDKFKYIIKICLEQSKGMLVIGCLYTIISGLAPVIILQLTKKIMNMIEFQTGNSKILVLFLVVIVFVNALQTGLSYCNTAAASLASYIMTDKFEVSVLKKISKIKPLYFDTLYFNDLLNRLYSGSNKDFSVLFTSIINIGQSIIIVTSYLVSLAFSNINIFEKGMILIASILGVFYRRYYFHKQDCLTNESFEKTNFLDRKRRLFNDIVFVSEVQDELKIFKAQKYFEKTIISLAKEIYVISKKMQYKIHNLNRIGAIGVYILERVVYLFLLYDIYKGSLNYGDFVLIVGVLEGLFAEGGKINLNFSSLYEAFYHIESIKEFHNLQEFPENKGVRVANINEIEFENVCFKYPDSNEYVLKNINLYIKEGEKIGILGENGSGKSTLLKLLLNLYEPDYGRITLNKIDMKEYNLKSLYAQISVVFQDFCKYAITIKEFITGDEEESEDNLHKMREAARKAGISELINNLPQKYDTLLSREFSGETTGISIGQWQKLSLARMYYRNSKIVVLDEPSASLDAISEKESVELLLNSVDKKIIILVSHNLANIVKCDHIVILSNGTIIAEGTHNELLKTSSLYKTMYLEQLNRFEI